MKITGDQVAAMREKAQIQGIATDDNVLVFLDDVERYNVIAADEEEGVVEVALTDESGEFFAIDDVLATMTHRGTVRIELPAWWQEVDAS